MISLGTLKILTPLQKLPKNVKDFGKFIVAKALKSCPKFDKSPNLVTLHLDQFSLYLLLLKSSMDWLQITPR